MCFVPKLSEHIMIKIQDNIFIIRYFHNKPSIIVIAQNYILQSP